MNTGNAVTAGRRACGRILTRALAGLSTVVLVMATVPGAASAEDRPAAPEATPSTDEVQLSWTADPDAESYTVLRQKDGDDDWEAVDTTTDAGWTDTDVESGETYRYLYKVTYSDGTTSWLSEPAEATVPDESSTPPPASPPPANPPPPPPAPANPPPPPPPADPPPPPPPPPADPPPPAIERRDGPPQNQLKDKDNSQKPVNDEVKPQQDRQTRDSHDPPEDESEDDPPPSNPSATARGSGARPPSGNDAFTVRTPPTTVADS